MESLRNLPKISYSKTSLVEQRLQQKGYSPLVFKVNNDDAIGNTRIKTEIKSEAFKGLIQLLFKKEEPEGWEEVIENDRKRHGDELDGNKPKH